MEAMSDRSASPAPKRRKGGLRQRLASATASTDRAAPKSSLVSWLEQSWAWGQLSPQKVQTIAAKAVEDMQEAGCATIPPNLQRLANKLPPGPDELAAGKQASETIHGEPAVQERHRAPEHHAATRRFCCTVPSLPRLWEEVLSARRR